MRRMLNPGFLFRLAQSVWHATDDRHLGLIAAGVAFYTMLAIFPGMAATIAIWGLFADPAVMQDYLAQVHEVIPDAAYGIIETQLSALLAANTGALGWATFVSLAVALYSVHSGVSALISGLNAIHASRRRAGIMRHGDEVITTTFTFIATAEAISYVGAKPVFVDVDPKTFNIDLNQVKNNITEKTKAVIPVHLFGQPVNMPELISLCQEHQLKVIEDCAQSFGADINGKQTGSFGDIGAFSFFPSKNLGCFGDGGLISTNSDEVFEHLNILRNHGMSVRYHHTEIGYNSRLDELQAVILRVKLKHINKFNDNRRRVDQLYKKHLAETSVITPYEDSIGKHVYHQYTCLHPDRDRIMQALQQAQIACAIYYPIPLHKQDVYQDEYKDLSLPNAESIVERCFSLPVYPELTEEKIQQVCEVIKTAI